MQKQKIFSVVLENAMSHGEAAGLTEFINNKFSSNPGVGPVRSLPYRPDEWDPLGSIQKIQDQAKEYIRSNFAEWRQIGPMRFSLIKTSPGESYSEEYKELKSTREIFYSVVVEPLKSNDIKIISHSPENSWEIGSDVSEICLLIVLREVVGTISYDYNMPVDDQQNLDF